MTVFLISMAIALSVSFLCSLAEAALLSLTPSQIADIAVRHPHLGTIWQSFKARIDRPIGVILTFNTAAHTIGAAVAGAQFNSLFGNEWIWLFSLIFTCAMLQFTEIIPKSLGVRFNRELALVIAEPLNWAIWISRPILHLIHWINRPFEARRPSSAPTATVEEIAALAGLARLSNQIGAHQERIIRGASRLSQLRLRQVMIPADQVSFLSTSQTLMEAVLAAHMDSHTRFPVCEQGDRDRVVGYVNFKEMIYYMRTNPNDPSFRGIIRPIYAATPDQSAADLMRVFVDQHVHIAVVRGDDGKTLGLVTLEDVIEELVGELEDEFDRLPRMIHPLSGDTWMVGGGVSATELSERLGLTLPEARGTFAAWLGQRLGRVPKAGDVHREPGAEFLVRRVRRGKVFEAAVLRTHSVPPPATH